MSEDELIEAERIERLVERKKDWANDKIDIDERFGPGSFGCHETTHVANMLAGLAENELCNHSAVLRDPRWFRLACEARERLSRLYQEIGAAHLPG